MNQAIFGHQRCKGYRWSNNEEIDINYGMIVNKFLTTNRKQETETTHKIVKHTHNIRYTRISYQVLFFFFPLQINTEQYLTHNQAVLSTCII